MMAVACVRRYIEFRRGRAGTVWYGLLDPRRPSAGAAGEHAGEHATAAGSCAYTHGFTATISAARAALRPSTRTQTAATAQSSANGNIPITKLPVDCLTKPTTFTMRPPPIRLEIALMPARPAASVLAESQLAESAQNGPLKA